MAAKKIWFDTDIGTDIDDAVALAYLLSNPDCELLGISTVSGQAFERAQIADAICRVAGKNVPIFPGTEIPLLTEQRQPQAYQAKQLKNWSYAENFPAGRAVEEMYQAIKSNPGQVTLLAVGPMTNIALLLKLHPDVPSLLKDLVLMCGEFLRQLPMSGEAEWNSLCDPYASAIVYGENLPLLSVGLDVTMQVEMNSQEVAQRFTSPVLKIVYDFAKPWFERRNVITFHDPLAAVSIFKPQVMEYAKGQIFVETTSSHAIGRTYFTRDENGIHSIGQRVNAEAFFEEYFRITTA